MFKLFITIIGQASLMIELRKLYHNSQLKITGISGCYKYLDQCQVNPFTPTVKLRVTQSSLTFDSMDRTLRCDLHSNSLESHRAVLYSSAVRYLQFYPFCNFGKFIKFGLGNYVVRSERVSTIF